MSFKEELQGKRACGDALSWVGSRSLEQAWNECERLDWMFWLLRRVTVDRKLLVLAACDCAELALPYCKNQKTLQAAMRCIHVTREWCEDRATIEDVIAGRSDACGAAYAAASYATYAAADAAYAACASDARAAAARADAAAACAADAYAYEAASYATYAEHQKVRLQCTQKLRERIPASLIAAAWDQQFKVAA